jgi:hypothetical protein
MSFSRMNGVVCCRYPSVQFCYYNRGRTVAHLPVRYRYHRYINTTSTNLLIGRTNEQHLQLCEKYRRQPYNAYHTRCWLHFTQSTALSPSFSSSSSTSSTFPSFSTMSDFSFLDDIDNRKNNDRDGEGEEELTEREMKRERGALKLQQLDEQRVHLKENKKGRGWTDPWDIEPLLESGTDTNALLDWAPEYVSRISQERVQIYSAENGRTIPTLSEMTTLSLPLPPPPNPTQHMKAYALSRKRTIQKYIYQRVVEHADPKIHSILKLHDWDAKQDAIDILYEQVEFQMKDQEEILGKQPNFGILVEKALETYLKNVQRNLKQRAGIDSKTNGTSTQETTNATGNVENVQLTPEQVKIEQRKKDDVALPLFIDCYDSRTGGDKDDEPVPKILIPMKGSIPLKPMIGRMIEEWELAAHKTTKRIMIRHCTRTIAQAIVDATTTASTVTTTNGGILKNDNDTINLDSSKITTPTSTEGAITDATTTSNEALTKELSTTSADASVGGSMLETPPLSTSVPVDEAAIHSTRILVHGAKGVGKTAALAAIVASARRSGAIVLFLPDGDQMHQNGFYIEPNDKRKGIYDLPILTQSVCRNMIEAHESDLQIFDADPTTMATYFTDAQLGRIKEYEKGTSINLVTLLNLGIERTELAPMCYAVAVDILMKQDKTMFIMVLDEVNCFFMPGKYFHESYDYDVKKPIPYHLISLFEPILRTMNITAMKPNEDNYAPTIHTDTSSPPPMIKRGAVIVSTTESHAVSRHITDALIVNAKILSNISSPTSTVDQQSGMSQNNNHVVPMHVIEVPRLTTIEVQHMLSNYEATGVGVLRLDRGATVMNQNEVSYLHMVSGGIPQHLMNACMM